MSFLEIVTLIVSVGIIILVGRYFLSLVERENPTGVFVLYEDRTETFLKSISDNGKIYINSLKDAKKFYTEQEAIEFNKKYLNRECSVNEIFER